jgi:hypothetical protein
VRGYAETTSAKGKLGQAEMRMMTKKNCAAFLATLLLSLLGGRSIAQEISEISGVVRSGQGNRLEVVSGDRRWIVVIDGEALRESKQRTEIEFHGHARGSVIERGMWVRFIADVDAAGKVVGELRELTWFTPVRTTQEGLFPIQQRPEEGEPIVDWGRPLRGEIVAGRYQVIGSVRSVRGGLMLVIYKDGDAERQLFAQLAPDVDVTIDISHKQVAYEMLKPGDAVVVRGRQQENQIQALSIVGRREEVLGKPLAVRPTPRPKPQPEPTDDNEPMPVASNDEPLPVGGSLGPVAEDDAPADGAPKPNRARILKVN